MAKDGESRVNAPLLTAPIEPMLARPATSSDLTLFDGCAFEPKWDGFRCLIFRSGKDVLLQGRGRGSSDDIVDLGYAFPELVGPTLDMLSPGTVVDGEIVVSHQGRLDFALLSSRLRPRSEAGGPSIAKLAATHPATFLAFDILAEVEDLRPLPLLARRTRLEAIARAWSDPLRLTPTTVDPGVASRWFDEFEAAGVDGLIVKPLDRPYEPGKRTQWKVKHQRTADVVVAGMRTKQAASGETVVASLLLGIHDEDGHLHYVGGASSFTAERRRSLIADLHPCSVPEGALHPWLGSNSGARVPGLASRWGGPKSWTPLIPKLVAEVAYDQMEGLRFRHGVNLLRWRPDRSPQSCTFSQLESPAETDIEALFQST